jgi:hypothetical protein
MLHEPPVGDMPDAGCSFSAFEDVEEEPRDEGEQGDAKRGAQSDNARHHGRISSDSTRFPVRGWRRKGSLFVMLSSIQ